MSASMDRQMTRSLVAISGGLDDSFNRFIEGSAADLKAMLEVALGALAEAEVQKMADQYCGGVEHMSPAERRFWREEAREQWLRKAAGGLGERAAYERLRAIGRGEDVETA